MTDKELNDIRQQTEKYLGERRLHDALATLKNATRSTMLFELTERTERLERNYAYMLQYLAAGADDPGRDIMLTNLVAEGYEILDAFVVATRDVSAPTLYHNIRRYRQRQGAAAGVAATIERWRKAGTAATSMSALFADAAAKTSPTLESAERELFNTIWTSYPLSRTEADAIEDIVNDESTPATSAARFVSALGLAALEFADGKVITTLCDIYTRYAKAEDSRGRRIAAAALVSLVTALYRHNSYVLNTATTARVKALYDLDTWRADVKVTFMELVRSRDTERINRTMTEEIIPQMMKMRPEIEKKIRDNKIDPAGEDIADNPEWEDLLLKSGIGDKLKELNEMQMEGSDVFMSTFSHLKNFPFFNEAVNWFTPMTEDSAEVDRILSRQPDLASVVEMVTKIPFLCDSDKYSMLLSVEMIPEQQRQMMLGQITGQSENLDVMRSQMEGVTDADHRRADVRNYIHNLYRFVNLFRRKSEFYNIFSRDMNLLAVESLRDALSDEDTVRLVGEFYMRRRYYPEAMRAFEVLDSMDAFDATLYQKMGYACEKTGRYDDALRYYEQADLLDSNSRWLKLRMAAVYRALGKTDRAIETLTGLSSRYPEDAEVAMTLGYTYIQAERYRDALGQFYKAEFLMPDSDRPVRPIAWSLFMTGDFDKAARYYDRINLLNPSGEDYLNMGHTALARGQFKDAINSYKLFILAADNDKEAFFKALDQDRPHLASAGISADTIALIADAMLYDLSK